MKTASVVLFLATLFFCYSEATAQTYLPVGPQTNVPVATVASGGWVECYRDTYDFQTMSTSTVLAACPGDRLMLACRQTGSGTLTLLAQGERSDVLFDTGDNSDVLHIANGVGWYYNETGTDSWGFVRAGDTVAKNNCDIQNSGADAERLCWHLNPSNGGYRCGATQDLNDSNAYERIVYRAGETVAIPAMTEYGMIILILLAGIGAVVYLRKQRGAEN